MPITVNEDIIRDSQLRETSVSPSSITIESIDRVFIVDGLAGENPDDRLSIARNAPGIPAKGAQHPRHSHLRALDFKATPLGANEVKVIATYRNTGGGAPGASMKSFSGSLQSYTTNFDAQGNLLTVGYETSDKTWAPQVITSQVLQPQPTLRMSRQMSVSDIDVMNYKYTYEGKVNSDIFLSGGPRTWLVFGVDAEFVGTSPTQAIVTFQFVHRPQTWDEIRPYIDQTTGQPVVGITGTRPTGLGATNGWLRWSPYEQVSYSGIPVL